jgi:hypothetical protein
MYEAWLRTSLRQVSAAPAFADDARARLLEADQFGIVRGRGVPGDEQEVTVPDRDSVLITVVSDDSRLNILGCLARKPQTLEQT